MTVSPVLDAAGRRRSPATLPGYHAGRAPRNKGLRYPADPPTVEEIIAVMRQAAADLHGARLRALIVVLWRGGLRVQEALALAERDLDPRRGSLLVRSGKGGRRREIGMDGWGWEQLRAWVAARVDLPVGPLFCIIDGPTRGRPWSSAAVRVELRRLAARARVRRRFAPHQLRHAHALELAREGGGAEHHPAPAGTRQPRNHVHLPAGHRHRGDHRRSPRPARPDDVRFRRASPLTEPPIRRGTPDALPPSRQVSLTPAKASTHRRLARTV
jgi:integrase